ncbi:MAG: hypothetical protein Q8O67_14525 [Deltaproteobacteria bacterium]|nr:hypothetical protein [Deltaproteobacteria bacterium]
MTIRTLTATKTKTQKATAPKKSITLAKKDKKQPAKTLKPGDTSKIARGARALKAGTPLAAKKSADKTVKAVKVEVPLRNIKTPISPKRAPKPAPGHKAEKTVRSRRNPSVLSSEIAEAMLGEMGMAGEDSALARQAARSQRERDLLARLAVSVGRYDEMPNLELAADIVFADDTDAVSALIAIIERHDDLHAPDAARVVCEVGTRAPDLLLAHTERLVEMIDVSQREMLPYTMLALSPVASRHADQLWASRDLFWQFLANLAQPADLAQGGAVKLLAALCAAGPDYARTLAGGLVDLLGKCMPKDVAFFAESVLPALGPAHSHRAKPVLDRRLKELTPAEVARLRRAQRAAQLGQPLAA